MKHRILGSVCIVSLCVSASCSLLDTSLTTKTDRTVVELSENTQTGSVRTQSLFVRDWAFDLSDDPAHADPDFDDAGWRRLDLPHDWSIEGEYCEDNPAAARGGFLPGGIAWYRKTFDAPQTWEDKTIRVTFDGIYMNGTVYVNGTQVAHQPYGYTTFTIDLTDHLVEGENVIAVRVDNEALPSGRWYTGSGIYRDVWLSVTDPVHVVQDGSFITTPVATVERVDVEAVHEVRNPTMAPIPVNVTLRVLDDTGREVARTQKDAVLSAEGVTPIDMFVSVDRPALWSPASPSLYTIEFTVFDAKGRERDRYRTRTGFRDLAFTVDRGFLINGEPLEIQGMCMHHDGGAVGAAVPLDVLRHRFQLLKDAGVNAIRTAHNPFAPEFYRLADEMGFLIMDEAFDGWETPKATADYGLYFDKWWERDLTRFIRRDRNHPSVVIWSVGNEVIDSTPETQKKLVDTIKSLDPTRPVTQGRGYFLPHTDIAGFNGHGEFVNGIQDFHAENPDTPVIGTEMTHTLHTRGVYRSKTEIRERDVRNRKPGSHAEKRWQKIKDRIYNVPDLTETEVWPADDYTYASSFDNNIVRMPIREEIKLARELPYLLGTFRWTAFDYLGESRGWPARTTNFGVIDLADLPKGPYYLYQSLWSKTPMVHVDPHWTHPGKEGVEVPVVVYTNLDHAELFLNDTSLGEKPMTDEMQIVWTVPYAPGELKVVARSNDGSTQTMVRRTAGEATDLSVRALRTSMPGDNRAVARFEVSVVDDKGTLVPSASNLIQVDVTGGGRLIGVENGDILDLTSSKDSDRNAFNGMMIALVQSNGTQNDITVTFSSDGLGETTHVIGIDD